MHTMGRHMFVFAASLSALAGFVDAVGFLHLGGYFISFMSGNSTRLAVNVADADIHGALLLAGIIACFVLGAMAGTLIRHYSHEHGAAGVLAYVALLLAMASAAYEFGVVYPAIALMVLAMGAENAILQRSGEMVVGLTYMTGALFKVGQRLAVSLTGGPKGTWAPYLLLWLGLVTGGVAGALMFAHWGLRSLWFASGWAAMLALAAGLFRQRLC